MLSWGNASAHCNKGGIDAEKMPFERMHASAHYSRRTLSRLATKLFCENSVDLRSLKTKNWRGENAVWRERKSEPFSQNDFFASMNVVLQKRRELTLSHVTCSWPFVISVHDRSWPVFMTVHDPLWVCLWSFMSNFYTFEYMPHPRMVHICVFDLYYISLVSKYVEWIYDGQNSIVQLFTQANDHNENQIKCPLLTTCLPHICFFIVLVYHKDTW
jgi:hypothetical protein